MSMSGKERDKSRKCELFMQKGNKMFFGRL